MVFETVALSAPVSLALYLWALRQSGGADHGKEVLQLYVPCGVYLLIAAWGAAAAALSRRKLQSGKAAGHKSEQA